MKKIATFDDWIDAFRSWQKDIDLRLPKFSDYQFEAKYGDLRTDEIEFGDFAGNRKWERVTQIPQQQIRDALLNLIVYQGDTEFASVEQQRNLLASSPSEYDTESVCRIMVEEMRHGWQMCHLLVSHFGETGKIEARKLLERRAWDNNRLLGSFNVDVDDWVDFFTYTEFVDRDGKFQLNMLSTSSFAPARALDGARCSARRASTSAPATWASSGSSRRDVVPPAAPPEVHQQVALDGLRPLRQGLLLLRGMVLRLGPQGPLRRGAPGRRAGQGALERALPRDVPRRGGQAPRGDQPAAPRRGGPLVAPDMKFHRSIGEFAGQT